MLLEQTACEELLPRFNRVERSLKRDGSVVTEADTAMQRRLAQALRLKWPEIPLLGEEMPAAEQERLLAEEGGAGLWLLDPLDGTSNFAAGIPWFAVSLALVVDGRVVMGVIHDPIRQESFAATLGGGATLNDAPLHVPVSPPPLAQCMGLVDFKRLAAPLAVSLVRTPPYASQRSFGSGALDWCMLASGRCQLYLHGGQRLWDYAAGQLILAEAGGLATTLEGEPVYRGDLAPRSVVAATSPELFAAWQARLEVEE